MPHFTIPAGRTTKTVKVRPVLAAAIRLRDSNRCVYCGRKGAKHEIDHVRPASHFVKGTPRAVVNAPSNLVACCVRCNSVKSSCGVEGFIEKLVNLGVPAKLMPALRERVAKATTKALG